MYQCARWAPICNVGVENIRLDGLTGVTQFLAQQLTVTRVSQGSLKVYLSKSYATYPKMLK